jgi:hypothetical protein
MPNTNIVEMTVDGGISAVEFDDIIGKLEAAIEKHGNVRLLKHIRSLGAVPVSKFWDDIRFACENLKRFSRAAVVADQKWIEVFTKMAKGNSNYPCINRINPTSCAFDRFASNRN